MSLGEQLVALEQELKRFLTANDVELAEAVGQTILPEWAAGASQEGYVAGTLLSVEQGCKLLRERLNVPLEVVFRVELSPLQIIGPFEEGEAPSIEDLLR